MSNDKQPIKQALQDFYTAKSLSDTQLNALQQTLNQQTPLKSQHHRGVFKWAGSIAASVLLLVVLAIGYLQTPELITAAYADIYKDVHLNNGMQASIQQWMKKNHIADVPQQYPVKMSKFCQLNQLSTMHLRIAGTEQGELNVFFHYGETPLYWRNRSGTLDNMNWTLVKARDDLTLIVMYTHDMREQAVQHILGEILPELQA